MAHLERSAKDMKIRIADVGDIPALIALFRSVHSLHATAYPTLFRIEPLEEVVATKFKKMIEDSAALLVLAEDPAPCGYIFAQFIDQEESWFWHAHRICNISHVVVRSDRRRRGVAGSLISRTLSEASARGYARIELDVWSFNSDAKNAFQKLGFEVFNERMEFRKKEPNQTPEPTAAAGRGSS